MANKYDASALAANADQLEALARSARSNMLSRTTEKATRLGAEGERAARQAKAADAQRADADALAKSHLTEAADYDAKANDLDRRAAAAEARHDPAGDHDARELREDAAKQREGAEVARSRSRIAAEDAGGLADEATSLRTQEQAIDAELADMGGRLAATELAVDGLEWHAEQARSMADTVRQADDLQAQAAAATSRGDSVLAAELEGRAARLRDDADVLAGLRERPPYALDEKLLGEIGIQLAPGALSVPLPELIDPNALYRDALTSASSTTPGDDRGDAIAASGSADPSIGDDLSFDADGPALDAETSGGVDATLDPAADQTVADPDPAGDLATTLASDTGHADLATSIDGSSTVGELAPDALDGLEGGTNPGDLASADASFGDSSLGESSSFGDLASADTTFSESFGQPDPSFDPPPLDDAGFADGGALA